MIKLLGKSMSLKFLEPRIRSLWKLEIGCEIIDMDNDYFCMRFYSRRDYFHVLERGPWIMLGHYMIVAKWRPNFHPSKETISRTAMWIRLPGLPLELFDETILMRAGGKLGKALKVDKNTMVTLRGRFARICLEIDLRRPLTPKL